MNRFQNYWDLTLVLTHKDLKVRYKSTFLGYLWSVAHPLARALVYYFAFKVIIRLNIENFAIFMIAALFPWQWLANSINTSAYAFIGNASLVKKINFPRHIIPTAIILQDLFHYVLSIPVIVVFLLISGKTPSLHWIYGLPLLLILQFVFLYGVTLIVSSLNLFFRDIERLVNIFIMLLFYLTPILYPEDWIYKSLGKYGTFIIYLNPATPLISSWRQLMMHGTLNPMYLLACLNYTILFICIGRLIYMKLSPRFAEVL